MQILSRLRARDKQNALRGVLRFQTELAALLLAPYHPPDPFTDRWWSASLACLRREIQREARAVRVSNSTRPAGGSGGLQPCLSLDSLRAQAPWLHRVARALVYPATTISQLPGGLYGWRTPHETIWFKVESDSLHVSRTRAATRETPTGAAPTSWPDPIYGIWNSVPSADQDTAQTEQPTGFQLRCNSVQPLYALVQKEQATHARLPERTLAELLSSPETVNRLVPPKAVNCPELAFLVRWLRWVSQGTR